MNIFVRKNCPIIKTFYIENVSQEIKMRFPYINIIKYEESDEYWKTVRGGAEEWKPTFYDPDSGGDPYYIHCECGIEFSIGYCEITDLAKAWNKRAKQIEFSF